MSYHRDNNRWKYIVAGTLGGLLVVAGIVFFHDVLGQRLSAGAMRVATPIFSLRDSFGNATANVGGYFRGKRALSEENDALRAEIADLQVVRTINAFLADENTDLKAVIERQDVEPRIVAAIVAQPNLVPYDTILIDAGRREGVRPADIVSVHGGEVALGTVHRVFEHSAQVTLFSNPGRTTSVVVGDTNVFAEARGRGGFNFEIRLPRDIAIERGAFVALPGIQAGVVGVVEHVTREPNDPFQTLLARSVVNIAALRFVEIGDTYRIPDQIRTLRQETRSLDTPADTQVATTTEESARETAEEE